MLCSVEALKNQVKEPLGEFLGPKTKVLTVESHGLEVRGLAFCPGKVVRYVFQEDLKKLVISELLTLRKQSQTD